MSNLTMLVTSNDLTKPRFDQRGDGGTLVMAATSIPVFWYALFDHTCFAAGPSPGTPPRTYLHLTTPTADGLARAEARWPLMASVIGRQLRVLFREWLGYIRQHADAHLHVETLEWWWMFETDEEFEAELRTCLSAFDRTVEEADDSSEWGHLLGQAHVGRGRKGELKPLANNSYCGFGGDCTPWSGDEQMVCGVLNKAVVERVVVGRQPADLLAYLEVACSPVFDTRLAVCRCGGQVFRLRGKSGSGAVRACVACGRDHYVMGSREYWEEEDAKRWTCAECGKDEANVAVGIESDSLERHIQFTYVGVRCVGCGRMASAFSWEDWAGVGEIDDRCNAASWLLGDGDFLVEDGKHAEALAKYREAWDELPEPREEQWPADELREKIAKCQAALGGEPGRP